MNNGNVGLDTNSLSWADMVEEDLEQQQQQQHLGDSNSFTGNSPTTCQPSPINNDTSSPKTWSNVVNNQQQSTVDDGSKKQGGIQVSQWHTYAKVLQAEEVAAEAERRAKADAAGHIPLPSDALVTTTYEHVSLNSSGGNDDTKVQGLSASRWASPSQQRHGSDYNSTRYSDRNQDDSSYGYNKHGNDSASGKRYNKFYSDRDRDYRHNDDNGGNSFRKYDNNGGNRNNHQGDRNREDSANGNNIMDTTDTVIVIVKTLLMVNDTINTIAIVIGTISAMMVMVGTIIGSTITLVGTGTIIKTIVLLDCGLAVKDLSMITRVPEVSLRHRVLHPLVEQERRNGLVLVSKQQQQQQQPNHYLFQQTYHLQLTTSFQIPKTALSLVNHPRWRLAIKMMSLCPQSPPPSLLWLPLLMLQHHHLPLQQHQLRILQNRLQNHHGEQTSIQRKQQHHGANLQQQHQKQALGTPQHRLQNHHGGRMGKQQKQHHHGARMKLNKYQQNQQYELPLGRRSSAYQKMMIMNPVLQIMLGNLLPLLHHQENDAPQ
ncbi:hypothetical protein BC941DRAFT_115001 [Chlamydoabsidia padenii]|nr:hypothetical protein BC941DRAFT_115001 [Chlamydoabsidia padenii]